MRLLGTRISDGPSSLAGCRFSSWWEKIPASADVHQGGPRRSRRFRFVFEVLGISGFFKLVMVYGVLEFEMSGRSQLPVAKKTADLKKPMNRASRQRQRGLSSWSRRYFNQSC